MTPIVKIILTVLIVVCVLLSGFFSASEIVYSGVRRRLKKAQRKLKQPQKYQIILLMLYQQY